MREESSADTLGSDRITTGEVDAAAPIFSSATTSPRFTINPARENDAPDVKALMDDQASVYAAYYYAMCAQFVRDTSFVARDDKGNVVGAMYGIYDFTLNQLLVSHFATATELAADQANKLKARLLDEGFANAAYSGVREVKLQLDSAPDKALAEMARTASENYDLGLSVSFRDAGLQQPEIPDITQIDTANVTAEDITFRNADPANAHADAYGIWCLIHKIRANSVDGGLDIYDISNYERLCRETPESVMLAEHDGRIVGVATSFRMPVKDKMVMFMWQTGTDPDYQRRGIAKKLEFGLIDQHNPEAADKPIHLYFTVAQGDDIDQKSYEGAQKTAAAKAKYIDGLNPTIDVDFSTPHIIGKDNLDPGCCKEVTYYIGPQDKPVKFPQPA